MICFLGICILAGGIAFTIYSKRLRSFGVVFFTSGFRFYSHKGKEDILWSEIGLVREIVLYERLPILHDPLNYLLPRVVSRSYTLVTLSNKEYGFDVNRIKNIKKLSDLLHEEATKRSLLWTIQEVHA
jgi:hypothetical protein